MAIKLVVLYPSAPDQAAFDRHDREVHMPLADKTPGLLRSEISMVTQYEIGAIGREPDRVRPALAAGGSGDKRDSSGQSTHASPRATVRL